MKSLKMLPVLAMACICVGSASGAVWVGTDGNWNDGANWDTGTVPGSSAGGEIANGGIARIQDGDVYTLRGIRVGAAETGTVVQTGGNITLTNPGSFDPNLTLGIGTTKDVEGESVYDMRGGKLTLNYYGQVGRNSSGSLLVSGGTVESTMWFSVGRLNGGIGTMVVSGGEFVQSADGTIIGEAGVGSLIVTNTGVFSSALPLRIGEYVPSLSCSADDCLVRIACGGTLSASIINCTSPGANPRGILELDGGRLVVAGNGATIPSFIHDLKCVRVLDGGAFFDTQSNIVTVEMPVTGAGTNEDFVKLGSGMLTLNGSNTWKGRTIVSNGTLTVKSPASLPGWDEPGRIFVCLGSGISFGNDWTAEQIATARANTTAEQGTDATYDTQGGDVTVTDNLALETGIAKQGAGTLTLAGNNSYAGALTVWGGLLRADFGTGLDATQPLVLRGGTYAPLDDGAITNAIGTGAGEISFVAGAASGFSAKGKPVSVRLDTGAGDGTLTWGAANATPTALVLNGAEADDTLTFENPIDVNGCRDVFVSVAGDEAVLAGGVRDGIGGGMLTKTGSGTLIFGDNTTNTTAKFAHGEGTTVFANDSTNLFVTASQDGGNVIVGGGSVRLTGNYAHNEGTFKMTGGEFAVETYDFGCAIPHSLALQIDDGVFSADALTMGAYSGSSFDITLNGGEMNVRRLSMICGAWKGESGADTCRFTQNGGVFRSVGSGARWSFGESGYSAKYEMNGGTAEVADAVLGWSYQTISIYNQTGGEFNADRFRIGYMTNSTGRVTVGGGTLTQRSASGEMNVGVHGNGKLEIKNGGTVNVAGKLSIGVGERAIGEVVVHPGGTLNAAKIVGGEGRKTSLTLLPGSTLSASGTGADGKFLDGVDEFTVFGNAVIDTKNRNVAINLPSGESTAFMSKCDKLTHRWSFNGNLADSVGGVDAVTYGGAVFDSAQTEINLPGGIDAGAVDLGANLLPAEGDVTIELWATQKGIQKWSRVFEIGSQLTDSILFAWTAGTELNTDDICFKTSNGGKDWRDSMAPYALDTEYHIAMTLSKREDDLWDVRVYKQDAVSGETLKKLEFTTTAGWSPATQSQAQFYLGRSHSWANDSDAKASYNEVRIWNAALSEDELSASVVLGADASLGGGFTKTGSGELAVAGSIAGYSFKVDEGTLALGKDPRLTHRWSFNGDLSDSAGDATATADGGAVFDENNTRMCLPGGNYGAGAINLGANLLPADGDVTIELWATQKGIQKWSRVFEIGSQLTNSVLFAWTAGESENTDDICFKTSNGGKDWRDFMAPYALGTEYHIAMTLGKRADGLWDVKVYKQDAVTGETLKKLEFTTTAGWSPATQSQSQFYLGRSHSTVDKDACADYNEVRIWNLALTEEQLSQMAAAGPDVIATVFESNEASGGTSTKAELAEGTSLSLANGACELGLLTGSGTIRSGSLTATEIHPGGKGTIGTLRVAGDAVVSGRLCIDADAAGACDCVVFEDALDARGLSIELAGDAVLGSGGEYLIAMFAPGKFVGPFASVILPGELRIVVNESAGTVKLARKGFSIIVR